LRTRRSHQSFAVMCQRILRLAGYSYCWECGVVKCVDEFYTDRSHLESKCSACKITSRHKLPEETGEFPVGYRTPEEKARAAARHQSPLAGNARKE